MKAHTAYMTFNTKERREFVRITSDVEEAVREERPLSVGLIGNAADIFPELVERDGRVRGLASLAGALAARPSALASAAVLPPLLFTGSVATGAAGRARTP